MSWATQTTRNLSAGKPIVFAFKPTTKDKIIGAKYSTSELIVLNKIDPNRLSVVYPKGFSLDSTKEKVRLSLNKTTKITEINKILKPYALKIKSGSKTTSRVLVYKDNHYVESILLENLTESKALKKLSSEIIKKVNLISRQP